MRLHRQPRRLNTLARKRRRARVESRPPAPVRHGSRGDGPIHKRQAAQERHLVALHDHLGNRDLSRVGAVPPCMRVSVHLASSQHGRLLSDHFQLASQHLRGFDALVDRVRQRRRTVQLLVDLALNIAVGNPQPQDLLPHICRVDLTDHPREGDIEVLNDRRTAEAQGKTAVEHVAEPEEDGFLVVEYRPTFVATDRPACYAVVAQVLAELCRRSVELPGQGRP